jgi:hypothetical protein
MRNVWRYRRHRFISQQSDGFMHHPKGFDGPAFRGNVDWAQIQKTYASSPEQGKYSQAACTGTKRIPLKGAIPIRTGSQPMAAGVADHVWSLEEIAVLLD